MKVRTQWLLATVGILVVVLAANTISPAFGGPSLFTAKKAKKLFFTKAQSNKNFLRKAGAFTQTQAASQFLTPAQGDSRYLPVSGTSRVTLSPSGWIAASPNTNVDHFTAQADLDSTGGISDRFFNADVVLPTVLQGRATRIDSFDLCYSVASPGATLDRVFLFKSTPQGAAFSPAGTSPIEDNTDRTDSGCRTYSAASPVAVGPNDLIEVVLQADYSVASTVSVSRLTINFTTG